MVSYAFKHASQSLSEGPFLVTLHITVSFLLTVYAIIKITIRGSTVPLHEFAAKQPKEENKLEVKNFL